MAAKTLRQAILEELERQEATGPALLHVGRFCGTMAV
jgi:hypothetical protein